MTEHKDFLGNPYDVGDNIIYAAMSGRSVTMVAARVVKFNDSGSVSVQPLKSSRWQQHSPNRYYVDSRTGKRVERYNHVKEHGYYKHKVTGERLPDTCSSYYLHGPGRDRKNPDYVPYGEREYVSTVFEDYLTEVVEPCKPVTLTVTDNIVKWDGVIPVDVHDEG